MVDLFTHMLAGFIAGTVLSWRQTWLTKPFVVVTMAGSLLPDLNRIGLLFPAAVIEATLGIPFSWTPLHRVAGTFLIVCLGALLAAQRHRWHVFVLLALGASSHYFLDLFLYKPSGISTPLLWPFFVNGFEIDGLYLSSDRWPAIVAMVLATAIWFIDRTRHADGWGTTD